MQNHPSKYLLDLWSLSICLLLKHLSIWVLKVLYFVSKIYVLGIEYFMNAPVFSNFFTFMGCFWMMLRLSWEETEYNHGSFFNMKEDIKNASFSFFPQILNFISELIV